MIRTSAIPIVVALLAAAATCIGQEPYYGAQPPASEPGCQAWEPPLGSIFRTRNLDPRQNRLFGHWNHQAQYVGSGYVVEAQSGLPYGYGVLRTPMVDFLSRPYEIELWIPRDRAMGERAAWFASSYVGLPYRPYSSVFPHLIPRIVPRLVRGTDAGMNCVDVNRRSYEAASGRNLFLNHDPDDLDRFRALFDGPYYVARYQPPLPAQPMGVTK